MLGHEQERLDALVGLHCVFDSLSHVQATISCFQKNSIEWTSHWKGAKKPLQVVAIHDLKHPAQRPLVNSVLEGPRPTVWPIAHPLFAALHESGIGPKGTCRSPHKMSTFGEERAAEFYEYTS
jgi:hypothetical protein